MSICPKTQKCRFFESKMAQVPVAADKVKHYYCYQNYMRCARYVYSSVAGSPPEVDLLPNDMAWVAAHFEWGLKKSD